MAEANAVSSATCPRKGRSQKLLRAGLLCLLGIFSVEGASSQSASGQIPENATPQESPSGWACSAGHRSNGSECLAVLGPRKA